MRLSVVIVDDDPSFLSLAAEILTELGFKVLATAADAAQAVLAVADSRAEAVLVDIGLPDRDGIDLAYELLELPWRPRVVLTSSDRDALVAIQIRDRPHKPPFIPKEELEEETLRRAFAAA